MSAGDFGYAVRGMLYAVGTAEQLPAALAKAAATGDLGELAQPYYDRQVRMERSLAYGVHFGIFCAEDIPFVGEKEIADATAGTFLGRYLFDEYRRACAAWPRAPVRPQERAPVTARVPVLLVSGAFDPVTPPEFAERVARSLPLARLVVAPRSAHGSATGCPRPAVLHLLAKGTFDGMPLVCQ